MTQAKAQTVAAALIGQGYRVNAYPRADDGQWVVKAEGADIPAATAATFATAQGVTALVDQATFE